ncbi:hypothetical protein Lbys_3358 [Leadbetterella byssophila DSM 17132]|uniref:Uncharacterized protein n=1 Tax=Leadbetterella byssophila (strain DSM 17132 / JCM 16389 / KACC 11308 / NBRC 106382 / 4M15) TaxID=649349 RepID=E4RX94_LEAB4|nr:hypothetical protein Lbys_3358 [Leadbetterella byssophila DSM 17132]
MELYFVFLEWLSLRIHHFNLFQFAVLSMNLVGILVQLSRKEIVEIYIECKFLYKIIDIFSSYGALSVVYDRLGFKFH